MKTKNAEKALDAALDMIEAKNGIINCLQKENKKLKHAIYMAAEESMVDGQGQFCRYCLATLDEYNFGHKNDCIYLICEKEITGKNEAYKQCKKAN